MGVALRNVRSLHIGGAATAPQLPWHLTPHTIVVFPSLLHHSFKVCHPARLETNFPSSLLCQTLCGSPSRDQSPTQTSARRISLCQTQKWAQWAFPASQYLSEPGYVGQQRHQPMGRTSPKVIQCHVNNRVSSRRIVYAFLLNGINRCTISEASVYCSVCVSAHCNGEISVYWQWLSKRGQYAIMCYEWLSQPIY